MAVVYTSDDLSLCYSLYWREKNVQKKKKMFKKIERIMKHLIAKNVPTIYLSQAILSAKQLTRIKTK